MGLLRNAIRSLVLRLKVLDIEQLEKEQGVDGTIPLRVSYSEIKELTRVFDDTAEWE